MKQLNLLILALFTLICLSSCEKEEADVPKDDTIGYANQIVLNDLQISGDSVKLSWSKLDTLKFAGYLIVRKDSRNVIIDPTDYNSQYLVKKIYDPAITSYTDVNVPLEPYWEYQVIGLLFNTYSYNYIFSNSKNYERPSIKTFDFDILDIIPDLSRNRFYIIERSMGRISIFDYETLTTVKSVTTNARIGYCSIGNNGGTKELYVPRSDGWIFVYNAETLEKIDQIDVAHPASCVINNQGKLYVSTDAWTNRPLKVFNRVTKTMIAENGDFEDTRLRIIPNTNTELLEVTINISPVDLATYKFDENGGFVSRKADRYHGDYPLNAGIFQFFPDGKKFITAAEGAIYDINLLYINRLPQGDFQFSDYAFNANASIIYCACSNRKLIASYSNSNYIQLKEYKTQGYPYKIFRKDNTLICITKNTTGSDYFNNQPYKIMIEKIQIEN